MSCRDRFGDHQMRSFQHANVLGNRCPADREHARNPADRQRTVYESPQDVSTNRHTKCGELVSLSNVLSSIGFHGQFSHERKFRCYFSSRGLPLSSNVFNDDSISGHPSAEPL